jgi:hypothetical protein
MLHPALTRALATAQVEDLHRAAAAAKLGRAEVPIVRSASTRPRGRRAPQADGMTPTEIRRPSMARFRLLGRRRFRSRGKGETADCGSVHTMLGEIQNAERR